MKSIQEKLEDKKWIVGDCWRYLGYTNHNGHARIRYEGRHVFVPRLILHLTQGFDLDSELLVLHKPECKFPDCWNPEHLYTGDHMQNMADYSASITHCRHGHEYTEASTKFTNGKRFCGICRDAWNKTRDRRVRHG
jgi:hypothetical protein